LTSVADTRLLIFMEFPATQQMGVKTRDFFVNELKQQVIVPTIVLTEFIKIAGIKIGQEAAKNRIRQLKERGLQIVSLDENHSLTAGSLLLLNGNIPIADAIIASYVINGDADYVLTDDPHYKTLNIKTKWLL
jgi:predicted nucleic acid-binding protein